MIEVLPGIYYDPSKPWYEQPIELIELATAIEQTPPIASEFEQSEQHPPHIRPLWATWAHATECGQFEMTVRMSYLYSIDNAAFMTKAEQNTVEVIKIA